MGEIRDNVKRNLGYYLSLKKISQKELAESLSVSQSAVTNWIKGKNSPDIEMVAQICNVLDISVTELFGTDGSDQYDQQEKNIIRVFRQLSEENKKEVLSFIHFKYAVDDASGKLLTSHGTDLFMAGEKDSQLEKQGNETA